MDIHAYNGTKYDLSPVKGPFAGYRVNDSNGAKVGYIELMTNPLDSGDVRYETDTDEHGCKWHETAESAAQYLVDLHAASTDAEATV